MKISIIVSDNAVYIDGVMKASSPPFLNLASCNIPSNVHALQWNESSGWIEFNNNDDGTKPTNELISELPDWANSCVILWNKWQPSPAFVMPT